MSNNPPGWGSRPSVSVPKTQLGNQKGRVNLQTLNFDELIQQQGVRVCVYRTMLCPNVKSIDGAEHEIDCTLCRNGFIDLAPIQTVAFIQQQTLEKPQFQEGYYDRNEVMGTFLQGIELQYYTLVELRDHTEIFFERIKRQRGQRDILKYSAVKINVAMDTQNRQYYSGIDFDVDVSGTLIWKAGKGPGKGNLYSVHYEHLVQFRAMRASHINRFAQEDAGNNMKMIKMNEQWGLAREFHVAQTDAQGNALPPNRIRDEDDKV